MKYTDVTENMCAICGKPHEPGKTFCRDCIRRPKLLIPAVDSAEGVLMTSDEICRRCRHSFAVKGGLCEDCRETLEKARAEADDVGKEKTHVAPPAEGEDRYRSVPPNEDLSNYEPMSADTKENILRCLTCEIPVEYCKGKNCVKAYRRWQADMTSHYRRRKAAQEYSKRTKK